MANLRFLVVGNDGYTRKWMSLPESEFPPELDEDERIVVPDVMPSGQVSRLDMRKVRRAINRVGSINDVMAKAEPVPAAILLDKAISDKCLEIDQQFAALIAQLVGPFAALHAEKRRQAEAGGGPLVAGEEDRLAILERVAEQDAALSTLDANRLKLKAAVRAAKSPEAVQTVSLEPSGDDRKIAALFAATP